MSLNGQNWTASRPRILSDLLRARRQQRKHGPDMAGVSNYKKPVKQEDPDTKKKLSLRCRCNKCGTQMSQFIRSRMGRINKTPYTVCFKCHKEACPEERADASTDNTGKKHSETAAIHGFISAVTSVPEPGAVEIQVEPDSLVSSNTVVLDHHIFTDEGWKKAALLSHPTLRLRISTLEEDYDHLNLTPAKISPKQVDVVADSGAQSCL